VTLTQHLSLLRIEEARKALGAGKLIVYCSDW
jgi:hypothetical protein